MVQVEDSPNAAPTEKPGWQTSEFWLAIAAIVVQGIMTSGLLGEGSVALKVVSIIGSVLTALGYTVARSSLKKQNYRERLMFIQRMTSDKK